jgi:hypothetical protein
MLVTARGVFAQTFDISWTGGYGPGSGIITATNEGTYFLVNSISGTQDGKSISLLGLGAYGGNDNRLYYPPTGLFFDSAGFGFKDGTSDYNIYDNGGLYYECDSSVTGISGCEALGDGVRLTELTVTTTPEPSTILLLLSGFGALLILAGRKVTA